MAYCRPQGPRRREGEAVSKLLTLADLRAAHPGERVYYLTGDDGFATRVRSRFVVYRWVRGQYRQVDSLAKLGNEWFREPHRLFAKVTR